MKKKVQDDKAIDIARYFLWVSSFFVIVAGVAVSYVIGLTSRNNIIHLQEEYLEVLAEDFNSQLFRRFSLPVVVSGMNVSLENEEQYQFLDETVSTLISGLRVEDVAILLEDGQLVYSTDKGEVATYDKTLDDYSSFFNKTEDAIFIENSKLNLLDSLLQYSYPDNTFQVRIYYPLSVSEEFQNAYPSIPILGVIRITIDITSSYREIIETQRAIFLIFACSVLLLFSIVQYVSSRAKFSISKRIEEVKELETQLYQQEKLASMGRMVASVAHEIRNPLGILQSSSELLKSRNEKILDPASVKILDVMIGEIGRLGNVVTDFVDYARPKKIAQNDVNLSFTMYKAITFLEPKIESSKVQIYLDIEDNVMIKGDENLLYRAFYNLISNSIQALENVELASLSIKLSQKGRNVNINISDNGTGFSEEALEKAFDPFFTTKDEGIGLGLPIVHSIMEAHNASIEISNLGKDKIMGASIELNFRKNK